MRTLASKFFCFITIISAAVAEEKPLTPLERVGEEAFDVLVEMYAYDESIPLEARVVEKKEIEGIEREKIVLRSTRGNLVPGYMQLPTVGEAPYPCVLLLHGWSGSKESWYADNNYISGGNIRKGLLEQGCAVFALDAQCHGDRISQNDFAPVNHYVDKEQPKGQRRKGYFTQQEIYQQTVVDYRRAMDYLEMREDIDSDRIGLVGYSMGGTQTFLLTAVEERIKVSVACATPADAKKFSLLAPQSYVRGIGERPFFMVMGSNDSMCPVKQAEELFELIESPVKKLQFYGGHHKLTHDFAPHAVEWVVEHLQH